MFITKQAPSRIGPDVTQVVERSSSIIRWAPERDWAHQAAHLLWFIAMITLVSACMLAAIALTT